MHDRDTLVKLNCRRSRVPAGAFRAHVALSVASMVACTARQDVTRVPATPSSTVNDPAESQALFFTFETSFADIYFCFP